MERHLIRDDSNKNKLCDQGIMEKKIGIKISKDFAEYRNGQLLLWMTCNLICRLKGIISKIEICVPDNIKISKPAYMPFEFSSTDLQSNLLQALEKCSDCKIVSSHTDFESKELDAIILIGSTTTTTTNSKFQKNVTCFDWLACIGNTTTLASVPNSNSNNPFGAFTTACIIVGDVFKFLNDIKPKHGALISELCFSTYDLKKYDLKKIKEAPNPNITFPINFQKLHICGSGAVAHSFCQAILALGPCTGKLFFIDRKQDSNNKDEKLEPTNLARYILATKKDIAKPKAELLARIMFNLGFKTDFTDASFETFANTIQGSIHHAISCVDNNDARHAIQEQLPKIIHGGSVNGLTSQISVFDLQSCCQCLKCYNDKDSKISDKDVLEKIKKLDLKKLKQLSNENNLDYETLCEYIENPECGVIGSNVLQKFANMSIKSDFSVNFATTLSGIFLAAEIIKNKNSKPMQTLNCNYKTDAYYNFWYNECLLERTESKCSCWCNHGNKTPRDIYRNSWN